MGLKAVMRLGDRMARRNFLYLFAWLCATVVPVLLQVVAGMIDEVRDYLAYYYSDLSLYMFFAMTFGFASVFVAYYLVGGFRLAGTLDLLRVSKVKPWEVSAGVVLAILKVLLPPLLAFVAGFTVYLLSNRQQSFIAQEPWWLLAGIAFILVANMVFLIQVPCLGIFRRVSLLALLGVVLVLPLNALPVILVFGLHWPVWLYGALMVAVLFLMFLASVLQVTRLWPAQRSPLT